MNEAQKNYSINNAWKQKCSEICVRVSSGSESEESLSSGGNLVSTKQQFNFPF